MRLTKKTIVDILKNNSSFMYVWNDEKPRDVIYANEFDQIADDIMTELNRTPKPKKECLSMLSRDGKHSPIISDDGVYCGICGMDLQLY